MSQSYDEQPESAVEAEPVVDFSRLTEVLIVMSGDENCKPESGGER